MNQWELLDMITDDWVFPASLNTGETYANITRKVRKLVYWGYLEEKNYRFKIDKITYNKRMVRLKK